MADIAVRAIAQVGSSYRYHMVFVLIISEVFVKKSNDLDLNDITYICSANGQLLKCENKNIYNIGDEIHMGIDVVMYKVVKITTAGLGIHFWIEAIEE